MFFIFTPTWGNDPILTNAFQMGWSHQLDPVSALFSQRLGVSFWLSMERWASHVILFCSLKRIPHAVHVYVHTGIIWYYYTFIYIVISIYICLYLVLNIYRGLHIILNNPKDLCKICDMFLGISEKCQAKKEKESVSDMVMSLADQTNLWSTKVW